MTHDGQRSSGIQVRRSRAPGGPTAVVLLLASTVFLLCERPLSAELWRSLSVHSSFFVAQENQLPRKRFLDLLIVDPDFTGRVAYNNLCSKLRWNNRFNDPGRQVDVKMRPRLIRNGKIIKLRKLQAEVDFDPYWREHSKCVRVKNRLRVGDVIQWTFRLRQTPGDSDDTVIGTYGFLGRVPRSSAATPTGGTLGEPTTAALEGAAANASGTNVSLGKGHISLTFVATESNEKGHRSR